MVDHSSNVLNGVLLDRSLPSQAFLKSTPRGAYTSILVRDGYHVREWALHVRRMARSLRAMHSQEAGMYGSYFSYLASAGGEADEPMLLDALIRPSALAALRGLQAAAGGVGPPWAALNIVLVPPTRTADGTAPSRALDVHASAHASREPSVSACDATVSGGPRAVAVAKVRGRSSCVVGHCAACRATPISAPHAHQPFAFRWCSRTLDGSRRVHRWSVSARIRVRRSCCPHVTGACWRGSSPTFTSS